VTPSVAAAGDANLSDATEFVCAYAFWTVSLYRVQCYTCRQRLKDILPYTCMSYVFMPSLTILVEGIVLFGRPAGRPAVHCPPVDSYFA